VSRQWTCRKCKRVNVRTSSRRCGGCGEDTKPKLRVAKHAETLRDDGYDVFLQANRDIHGVGEVCAVCGRPPSSPGALDREHGHAQSERSFGRPRGLACRGFNGCNKRLARTTLEQARRDVAYLERCETHYATVGAS
jgi:hypothetical protein